MSFKENLLKKMAIDRLADQVIASIGPSGSGKKADRAAMRRLIEMGPHEYQKERDLDLFLLELAEGQKRIFVLDNELALYDTTVEDVGLRKSPTLKEMLSIRNAIKILNDKDVKKSTREDSVNRIREAWISGLDLSFGIADLNEIESDGIASMERGYAEGVIQSLELFGEILGYVSAPKGLEIAHCRILGGAVTKPSGEKALGPVVIYSIIHNALRLVESPVGIQDKDKIEHLHQVASGKLKGDREGADVYQFLKEEITDKKSLREK